MQLPAAAAWAWIPIVIWAAFAQTIRNAAQRTLTASLGTLAATLVRFLYGLPVALAWVVLSYQLSGADAHLPPFGVRYALWLTLGATAQLAATACLLAAMRERNFIVGVTFSKTEVLQVGIFATLFLQEWPTPLSGLAMVVATVGVVLLSLPRKAEAGAAQWRGNAALFGLASGAFFALSSVGYRGAALQLPGGFAMADWRLGGAAGATAANCLAGRLAGVAPARHADGGGQSLAPVVDRRRDGRASFHRLAHGHGAAPRSRCAHTGPGGGAVQLPRFASAIS